MFKLAVAVLALAAVGIQGRPHSDAVAYDCTGKLDGAYPDATDPKAFFTCQDEVLANRVVCVNGYVFNGIDTCIPEVQEVQEVQEDEMVTDDIKEKERQTIPQVYSDNGDDEDFDDDFEGGNMKKKIFNIEFTKNIFPRSVVIIGKMNREQKNK